MSNRSGLKLGTTLYSFTNEFHGREYSLEQIITKVAACNLGPGLEIVGFSAIKGFPAVSDAFAASFSKVVAENKLELSCLGINADAKIDRDKPMNTDELVAYHEAQIRAAAKLGFPVVRYQYGAGPAVIERLVPLAERLNVKLGLEIHAPHTVDHPDILAYREMYQRMKSPVLGFIPDFGACAHTVSPLLVDYFRKTGIKEELIKITLESWAEYEGDQMGRRPFIAERLRAAGADDTASANLGMVSFFGRMKPSAWAEIMPEVIHIHGKCFDFAPDGSEISVNYEEVLPVFVKGGYSGYMSTEWEGHHFSDAPAFPYVQAHHVLCERILSRV